MEAWRKGLDQLGCPDGRQALGILGEPGEEQKLVIVTPRSYWAVKIAIGRDALKAIQAEAHQYEMLQASNWPAREAAPKVKRLSDDMMLLERLEGVHPQWDDPHVHRWIKEDLIQDSSEKGIFHGDVTPWNVISAQGSYKLLDWEKADSLRYTSPTNNLLDYILRGAAVKHVRPAKVHGVMADHLKDVVEQLAAYRTYRKTLPSPQMDGLAGPVERYIHFSIMHLIEEAVHA
jgi:hypothetical protein